MVRKKVKNSFLERIFQWTRDHKVLVISFGIILFLILSAFGTQIVLYARLALGNDIIIKLGVNKDHFELVRGDEGKVEFEAEVVTNPFCKAFCSYSFNDVSSNNTLEHANFTLRPTSPIKREFSLLPPKKGSGLLLYRFDMECYSTKTLLCHTKGEPSTRSILVTVNYDLNEEEKLLKDDLIKRIENLKKGIGRLQGQLNVLREVSIELNKTISSEDIFENWPYPAALYNKLYDLLRIWDSGDYELLRRETANAEDYYKEALSSFADRNNSLSLLISSYNGIVEGVFRDKDGLRLLQNKTIKNSTYIIDINNLVEEFNMMLGSLQLRDDISKKIGLQRDIGQKVELLKNKIDEYTRRESIRLLIEVNTNYDLLCEISNECIDHVSIRELSVISDFELNKSCSSVEELKGKFREANESMYANFLLQNYPQLLISFPFGSSFISILIVAVSLSMFRVYKILPGLTIGVWY